MIVDYTQPAIAWPVGEIQFGTPSWDYHQGEKSVRYSYPNARGGFNNRSPEVAMWTVLEMLEVCLKQGGLSHKQVLDVVSKTLPQEPPVGYRPPSNIPVEALNDDTHSRHF